MVNVEGFLNEEREVIEGSEKIGKDGLCKRFEYCIGVKYNEGFSKYLCRNPHLCATENPLVSIHPENFFGKRFKWYSSTEENHNYV